ncbi:uncharacterized protein TNCV_569771 [Trichonephila clavipes]|nr:uncharacterized protein TNCV_569771 [Trichonephila clavipes]
MTCDARDCGFQMLNDDEIVTFVQEESDPVDDEIDENEDINNESSKGPSNADAFSALKTAMECGRNLTRSPSKSQSLSSLEGLHNGTLNSQCTLAPLFIYLSLSLSNHLPPNHPSVISYSFAVPVGLNSLDLLFFCGPCRSQLNSSLAQWAPISRCTLYVFRRAVVTESWQEEREGRKRERNRKERKRGNWREIYEKRGEELEEEKGNRGKINERDGKRNWRGGNGRDWEMGEKI